MIENVSVSAEAAPGRVRCPKRLIWVVAVFAGVALSFGASAAQALNNDGSTSVTATPEDPCLLNHTCGEETPGAGRGTASVLRQVAGPKPPATRGLRTVY